MKEKEGTWPKNVTSQSLTRIATFTNVASNDNKPCRVWWLPRKQTIIMMILIMTACDWERTTVATEITHACDQNIITPDDGILFTFSITTFYIRKESYLTFNTLYYYTNQLQLMFFFSIRWSSYFKSMYNATCFISKSDETFKKERYLSSISSWIKTRSNWHLFQRCHFKWTCI